MATETAATATLTQTTTGTPTVTSPIITAYKVRTVQRSRTLTSGEKYVHKYYLLDYCIDTVWREDPHPYTDRAQAVRRGKELVAEGRK